MEAINFNPMKRPRRQDMSGEFIETGMFYFAKVGLLQSGVFQNNKCDVVEIAEDDSLEIDTLFQLQLAESLLSIRRQDDMNKDKI